MRCYCDENVNDDKNILNRKNLSKETEFHLFKSVCKNPDWKSDGTLLDSLELLVKSICHPKDVYSTGMDGVLNWRKLWFTFLHHLIDEYWKR